MARVESTGHTLTWVDRQAGYRMRCSCRWLDPTIHRTEDGAIRAATSHIFGSTPRRIGQRLKVVLTSQRRLLLGVVVVALVVVIIILIPKPGGLLTGSLADGYRWGAASAAGRTAPSCSHSEMASSGQVKDANFLFNKPYGDGKPGDKFIDWQAGCKLGATQTVIEGSKQPNQ